MAGLVADGATEDGATRHAAEERNHHAPCGCVSDISTSSLPLMSSSTSITFPMTSRSLLSLSRRLAERRGGKEEGKGEGGEAGSVAPERAASEGTAGGSRRQQGAAGDSKGQHGVAKGAGRGQGGGR